MPIRIHCDQCKDEIRTYHLAEVELGDYSSIFMVKVPEKGRLIDIPGKGQKLLCEACQKRLALALSDF